MKKLFAGVLAAAVVLSIGATGISAAVRGEGCHYGNCSRDRVCDYTDGVCYNNREDCVNSVCTGNGAAAVVQTESKTVENTENIEGTESVSTVKGYYTNQAGNGTCIHNGNYVDADGSGVCDHYEERAAVGTCGQGGHHGNGRGCRR